MVGDLEAQAMEMGMQINFNKCPQMEFGCNTVATSRTLQLSIFQGSGKVQKKRWEQDITSFQSHES